MSAELAEVFPELKIDPAFLEEAEQSFLEFKAREEAEKRKKRTIAERLAGRIKGRTEVIEIDDGRGGKIPIEVWWRMPEARVVEFLDAVAKMDMVLLGKQNISEEEAEEIENKICRFLADYTVDESLDFDFWKNGEYDTEVKLAVIEKAAQMMEEMASFRGVKGGGGALPDGKGKRRAAKSRKAQR